MEHISTKPGYKPSLPRRRCKDREKMLAITRSFNEQVKAAPASSSSLPPTLPSAAELEREARTQQIVEWLRSAEVHVDNRVVIIYIPVIVYPDNQ